MDPDALLSVARNEARRLLAAAETRWERPVPHCPEWDAAGLVRHTGGILEWMAAVVTSGQRVSRRALEPPPENVADLATWYLVALDRTIEVLGSADPDSTTWTFSSVGDQRERWWCRRLAVEVGIHRWDIEHAVAGDGGLPPDELDGEMAGAGVEEFVVEFLPGLLAQDPVAGLTGPIYLDATDAEAEWWIDLDSGSAHPERAEAGASIRGTRSDLLLWLTNRGPLLTIEVTGDPGIGERWRQLRR